MRDVSVDALDAPPAKLAHDRRVEVDHEDLVDELPRLLGRALVLELVEDRARVGEEAQKDQGLVEVGLLVLLRGRVEGVQTNGIEGRGEQPMDRQTGAYVIGGLARRQRKRGQ